MWWPFRALSGGGGNAIGFFRCDPAHLILRLLPGAGGVLPTCEESIATVTVEDLRNCTDVLIPWIQVKIDLNINAMYYHINIHSLYLSYHLLFYRLHRVLISQTHRCQCLYL